MSHAIGSGPATLFISDVTVGMKCRGCGWAVAKLDQEEADRLRQLESREGLEILGLPAFECRNCQVVIFEDELIGGERFVPADFRPIG